ncbi:hypothetical protein BHE74_00019918 [Ensete ventricosum]|nr:hypothetical protein BHE74_00019918 [Ensete ventricosum]
MLSCFNTTERERPDGSGPPTSTQLSLALDRLGITQDKSLCDLMSLPQLGPQLVPHPPCCVLSETPNTRDNVPPIPTLVLASPLTSAWSNLVRPATGKSSPVFGNGEWMRASSERIRFYKSKREGRLRRLIPSSRARATARETNGALMDRGLFLSRPSTDHGALLSSPFSAASLTAFRRRRFLPHDSSLRVPLFLPPSFSFD